MKSTSLMKPTSLLIACCATTALAFLIGFFDNSYAARGGGRGGFSRGGTASSGSFSAGAAGPAGAGRAGVGGQAGVGGGPAGAAGVGDAARVGNVAAAAYVVLPCSANAISVNGITYYSCGTTYYTQSYSEGSVVYVQSAPPPGY